MRTEPPEEFETLKLSQAAEYLLDESRMILPGIQALFGFQLIAVFSPGFTQKLSETGQKLHLAAIALTAVAVALVMTPAALHRQAGGRKVTASFIRIAGRLIMASMFPLAVSISTEIYLVTYAITNRIAAAILAGAMFLMFITLWFILPRIRASRD